MKKRILALACACVIMLSMTAGSLQAFAATSSYSVG